MRRCRRDRARAGAEVEKRISDRVVSAVGHCRRASTIKRNCDRIDKAVARDHHAAVSRQIDRPCFRARIKRSVTVKIGRIREQPRVSYRHLRLICYRGRPALYRVKTRTFESDLEFASDCLSVKHLFWTRDLGNGERDQDADNNENDQYFDQRYARLAVSCLLCHIRVCS